MTGSIVLIIVLITLSAFFSACETAYTSVNRIRLKNKAENGSKSAENALKILSKYDKALSTILIGNNIVNITTSSVATIITLSILPAEIGEKYGALISTICVTLIVLTFGEIMPKTIVRLYADNFCISVSRILSFLMVLFTPLSAWFSLLQRLVNKLFGKNRTSVSVTEEELIHIIEEIEDEGVLEEQEGSLVRSALEFDEITAGEILTPRVNIVAVSLTEDVVKVRDLFFNEGYSRLPVYEKTIDRICGVINTKDFMQRMMKGGDFQIIDILQDVIYVPSLMKISEVLKLMQKQKLHIAVVVDQYGGTEGIVTMEDIIEELVGEIWDEGDEVYSPVNFIKENVFEVSGNLQKNDFNRYFEKHEMDFEITSDCNTVGGWVFELFGKIPEERDMVKTDDFIITVLSVSHRKINKLRFEILKPKTERE